MIFYCEIYAGVPQRMFLECWLDALEMLKSPIFHARGAGTQIIRRVGNAAVLPIYYFVGSVK